ncbi:hypothetical protein [Actinomadura chibensis]|uniref:Peptidase inhibitor family I36 protein n=1 Tax=Actinomadura chibensis TaxID=392828 RepID=A0A5D0NPW6_9ACTN|nr:hypothetical protein [Actinomadura chibensis]TYB46653.1 hypothetical protein FXF69_15680 [Actinomadura chibensis]
MWRTLSHISLTASVVAALAVAPAAAAAAAGPPDTCRTSHRWLCGWSENDYRGVEADFDWTPCQNSPVPLRSVSNTVGKLSLAIMAVYSGPDCTGEFLGSVSAQQKLPYLPKPGMSVAVAV